METQLNGFSALNSNILLLIIIAETLIIQYYKWSAVLQDGTVALKKTLVLLMLVIRIAKWQNMVCGAIDDLLALTLLIRRL
jgi:hypothetical protein